jgi:hypothetical protein
MNYFDTTVNSTDYLMTINGLSVGLNLPEALHSKGEGEEELTHGLPPYRPRRAYLVDEYPACPDSWLRSSGRIKSCFVPIMADTGLWLDFNACSRHANHTAIVISVQGINAVTGLPCKDAQLEQYKDQCPKHKEPFGPDRLCKKCNFKWPKQNYLSSTGTPYGALWLDGFRAEDGKVRQYVFTEQKLRSVAKAIIGEDRVFALGISYFLSKEPRPVTAPSVTRGYHGIKMNYLAGGDEIGAIEGDTSIEADTCSFGDMPLNSDTSVNTADMSSVHVYNMSMGTPTASLGSSGSKGMSAGKLYSGSLNANTRKYSGGTLAKKHFLSAMPKSSSLDAPVTTAAFHKLAAVKQMEIAAGARIDQQVHDDPNDLEFWQKEPEGLIVINYCTQSEAMKIIRAGKVDVSGSKEGFLQNVPKGNP